LRIRCVGYCRIAPLEIRKPLFSPLNYGNSFQMTEVSSQRSDFRMLKKNPDVSCGLAKPGFRVLATAVGLADCKQWTRALTPMFETEIKSLRFLFSWFPDSNLKRDFGLRISNRDLQLSILGSATVDAHCTRIAMNL